MNFISWIKNRKKLLSKKIIINNVNNKALWENITIFEKVDSTNEIAKLDAKNDTKEIKVYLSEMQKSGKGRLGSSWEASKYKNIILSILLNNVNSKNIKLMPFIAGLSVYKAIQNLKLDNIKLKWPNDILLNKKKLCGILCESVCLDNETRVAVGIGINVNQKDFRGELKEKATSLLLETGKEYKREEIIANILNNLEKYMLIDNYNLMEEYKSNCISIGAEIDFIRENKLCRGKIIDISYEGEIIVQSKEKILKISSINRVKQYIR